MGRLLPEDAEIELDLAMVFYQEGRLETAISSYFKAVTILFLRQGHCWRDRTDSIRGDRRGAHRPVVQATVAVRPRRVRPNPRGRTGGRASQMTHSLAVQSEVEINLSDGLDRPI